jgi:hypothetical protein
VVRPDLRLPLRFESPQYTDRPTNWTVPVSCRLFDGWFVVSVLYISDFFFLNNGLSFTFVGLLSMYALQSWASSIFFKSANPKSVNSWAHSALANLQIS